MSEKFRIINFKHIRPYMNCRLSYVVTKFPENRLRRDEENVFGKKIMFVLRGDHN